ncbi:SSI family serine proteinase inhibitor [Streptomyces sp. PmtG]
MSITVTEESGGTHTTYELDCGPAGDSDHPSPDDACERLDQLKADGADPFRPVARDAMCTQVYGGPQTAHVTGTWQGHRVDASFKRTNGCEVSRWNALVPVLPSPGA